MNSMDEQHKISDKDTQTKESWSKPDITELPIGDTLNTNIQSGANDGVKDSS